MPDDERISRHAGFTAIAGRGDELAALLLGAAGQLEALPACEQYLVGRSPDEGDTVWVSEVWASRAAADEAVDPGSEAVQAVLALLAEPPQVIEFAPEGGVGPRGPKAPAPAGGYAHTNLLDVEDLAPKFGLAEMGEARVPRTDLGAERTGLAHYRQRPGRQAFGHVQRDAEEIFVVLAGAGRVKLDDEIVELAPLDALRVGPGVMRQFEAGPDGMEFLAFGPHVAGDAEMTPGWWEE